MAPRAWLLLLGLVGACQLDWSDSHPSVPDAGAGDGDGDGDGGGMACRKPSDCPDAEAFACVNNQCVEYECHAQRACTDPLICAKHACVPFTPPKRMPSAISSVAGAARSTSEHYQLQWNVGDAQPAGTASSERFSVTTGPGAGRP